MPLSEVDSRNLEILTNEAARMAGTVDDLLSIMDSGQSGDVAVGIATHNNDAAAHGPVITTHNNDAAAHGPLLSKVAAINQRIDGLIVSGDIRFWPFRAGNLPAGWYFANGDQYLLTSPQGAALSGLDDDYKSDWGIVAADGYINVPNMFYSDGRGMFLRAANNGSRMAGSVELDSFQGHIHRHYALQSGAPPSLTVASGSAFHTTQGPNTGGPVDDGTNGVPRTAAETRSLNIGMTPAIYLGV